MRYEASVGDLDADDHCADADKAAAADHRVVHYGFEADEGLIADVAGAVHQGVVRDRDVATDEDGPALAADVHVLVFERVQHDAVLDVGVVADEKGRALVSAN